MFEKMKDIIALAKRDAEKFMVDKFAQTANITGIAMAIFVLVVIGYVSIFVVNEIHGIAGITSGSVFYTASNKVISVMNTSWGMINGKLKLKLHGALLLFRVLKPDIHSAYRCNSGPCRSDNCGNQRRIRGRCWWRNDVDKISIDYNKRGQFPSPTFIF